MNKSPVKEILLPQLKRHEGLCLKPYHCTENKLTIGYGRNLEDRGITNDEADYLLSNDLDAVLKQLEELPIYQQQSDERKAVLANMCFQLGYKGLMKFRKMWAALGRFDFDVAATEMLDSRWARQTPERARELSESMRGGE